MTDPLLLAARHGQWVLVGGLAAGLALPGLAAVMRPWLPALVAVLMFVSFLRMRPGAVLGSLRALPRVAGTALVLQLALPLGLLVVARAAGIAESAAVLALVLMASAPSIMGSPNISMMLVAAPDHAMRLMVTGTALMPLTVLPVFALMPALQGAEAVGAASLRLVGLIVLTGAAALAIRRVWLRDPAPVTQKRLEGASSIALAVFVVGLMPQVAVLALSEPLTLVFWAVVAFAANLGAQALTWSLVRSRMPRDHALPLALIAGNRNIALFLVSLPPEVTTPILGFIGCYQLPMYLTPILMRRLYRANA